MKEKILTRFLKYISYNTQSDENSNTYPSTPTLMDFANLLAEELKTIGLENVVCNSYGIVMAQLPANTDKNIPSIGFIAHMDTSPDFSGADIHPQIIENYNGENIPLNAENELDTATFKDLKNYIGQTIICTDGTTLLGADDKAGVTEIICAMEYLMQHPEIHHGTICIAFTPDEEIGRGVDNFHVDDFKAQFAYTIDGGKIGEIEYENFNAAQAEISIHGKNTHPGEAKDVMVNSQLIAMELQSMLPERERPELTAGHEGFFLLTSMTGCVESTTLKYIIRDHDKQLFENKKNILLQIVATLNKKYNNCISCQIRDQYYNMKEKIAPVQFIVDIAKEAALQAGVEPIIVPIRGGTDGAILSYKGLPCPNLFTGGHNFHGKFEYVVLESMEKSVETIINIVKIFAER